MNDRLPRLALLAAETIRMTGSEERSPEEVESIIAALRSFTRGELAFPDTEIIFSRTNREATSGSSRAPSRKRTCPTRQRTMPRCSA